MARSAFRTLAAEDVPPCLVEDGTLLRRALCATVSTSSGAQALRILGRPNDIDLVIADQVMPGMTGTQLITAILAMTAQVDPVAGESDTHNNDLSFDVKFTN